MQATTELTCFYGNKTDKVYREAMVIEYTCMLCHIQLSQTHCILYYSMALKKINKNGRCTTRFPLCSLSYTPFEGREAKTDHATRMSHLLQEAGAV